MALCINYYVCIITKKRDNAKMHAVSHLQQYVAQAAPTEVHVLQVDVPALTTILGSRASLVRIFYNH